MSSTEKLATLQTKASKIRSEYAKVGSLSLNSNSSPISLESLRKSPHVNSHKTAKIKFLGTTPKPKQSDIKKNIHRSTNKKQSGSLNYSDMYTYQNTNTISKSSSLKGSSTGVSVKSPARTFRKRNVDSSQERKLKNGLFLDLSSSKLKDQSKFLKKEVEQSNIKDFFSGGRFFIGSNKILESDYIKILEEKDKIVLSKGLVIRKLNPNKRIPAPLIRN